MMYRKLTASGTGYYFTTSGTTKTSGLGTRNFVVPSGLTFITGESVTITSRSQPTVFMIGTVVEYVSIKPSTVLAVLVTSQGAAGSASDWVINTQDLIQAGDMMFGAGRSNFYIDQVEAVAQSVLTRLRLWTGEWFLDETEGTPYLGAVLGAGTSKTFEPALRDRILSTPGVIAITDMSTSVDATSRIGSFTATVDTVYGAAAISGSI